MPEALAVELTTYQEHRERLLATAEGKFALIYGTEVIGEYDTKMDAIRQGYRQLGDVPFLVKQVLEIETPLQYVSSLLNV